METLKAINLRGDLGCQIIQLFAGVAYSYDQNLNFCLKNNVKNLPISYTKSSDIRNIISNNISHYEQIQDDKEYNFYLHGTARLISKYRSQLNSTFVLRQFKKTSRHSAVIFSANTGNCEVSSFHNCSKLIGLALSQYENIHVIGNCSHSVKESLQNKFSSLVSFDFTESLLDQWKYLAQACHIFSAPVPFAYAHKLIDLQKKITILSPAEFSKIEDFLSDYIFISELKKYSDGINFTPQGSSVKLDSLKENSFYLQRLIGLVC